jgi:poly(hydroxyalkanoate) granule-associated protein
VADAKPRAKARATSRTRRKPARRPAATTTTSAPRGTRATGWLDRKWLELVFSVVQAPVGLAQSQTERLVGELVKTGDIGQREAERLVNELRAAGERAQGRAEVEAGRLDRFIEGRIEDVLNRVNIPTRTDIERLNSSVEVLTAKVEALVSRQAAEGRGGSR